MLQRHCIITTSLNLVDIMICCLGIQNIKQFVVASLQKMHHGLSTVSSEGSRNFSTDTIRWADCEIAKPSLRRE